MITLGKIRGVSQSMGHRVGRQWQPIRSRGHERRLFPELNNATEWLPLRRPESRPLATIVPLANEKFLCLCPRIVNMFFLQLISWFHRGNIWVRVIPREREREIYRLHSVITNSPVNIYSSTYPSLSAKIDTVFTNQNPHPDGRDPNPSMPSPGIPSSSARKRKRLQALKKSET